MFGLLNMFYFTSLIKSMFCSTSSIYMYIIVISGRMIIMVTFIILYFVDLFKSSHLLYYTCTCVTVGEPPVHQPGTWTDPPVEQLIR